MPRAASIDRAPREPEEVKIAKKAERSRPETVVEGFGITADEMDAKLDEVLQSEEEKAPEKFAVGTTIERRGMVGQERWEVKSKDEKGNVYLAREDGKKFAVLPESKLQLELDTAKHIPALEKLWIAAAESTLQLEDERTKDLLEHVLSEYQDEILESAAITVEEMGPDQADLGLILKVTIDDVKNDIITSAISGQRKRADALAEERREVREFLDRAERIVEHSGLNALQFGTASGESEEHTQSTRARKGALGLLDEAESTIPTPIDIASTDATPPRGIKARPIDSPPLYDAMVRGEIGPSENEETPGAATFENPERHIQYLREEIRLLTGVILHSGGDPEALQLSRITRRAELEQAMNRALLQEQERKLNQTFLEKIKKPMSALPRMERRGLKRDDIDTSVDKEHYVTARVLRTELDMGRLTYGDVDEMLSELLEGNYLSPVDAEGARLLQAEIRGEQPALIDTLNREARKQKSEAAKPVARVRRQPVAIPEAPTDDEPAKEKTIADILTAEAKNKSADPLPKIARVDRTKRRADNGAATEPKEETLVDILNRKVKDQSIDLRPQIKPVDRRKKKVAELLAQEPDPSFEPEVAQESQPWSGAGDETIEIPSPRQRVRELKLKGVRASEQTPAIEQPERTKMASSKTEFDSEEWFNKDESEYYPPADRYEETPVFLDIVHGVTSDKGAFLDDFKELRRRELVDFTLKDLSEAAEYSPFAWVNPKNWGKKRSYEYIIDINRALKKLHKIEAKEEKERQKEKK